MWAKFPCILKCIYEHHQAIIVGYKRNSCKILVSSQWVSVACGRELTATAYNPHPESDIKVHHKPLSNDPVRCASKWHLSHF